MSRNNANLTYYNGWWWHRAMLADGTRTVQPFRTGGSPEIRGRTRYYRRPGLAHS